MSTLRELVSRWREVDDAIGRGALAQLFDEPARLRVELARWDSFDDVMALVELVQAEMIVDEQAPRVGTVHPSNVRERAPWMGRCLRVALARARELDAGRLRRICEGDETAIGRGRRAPV